jgi:dTDP-4-dehydrorhamnose 3,5-epimerase
MHYQIEKPQGKLIRVTYGSVLDVAIDIRKDSPTFGHYVSVILSADNKLQMWIPEGFAHGFLVLSEKSNFLYKATNYYAPEYERCILWNDNDINIDWKIDSMPILSPKDSLGSSFKEATLF